MSDEEQGSPPTLNNKLNPPKPSPEPSWFRKHSTESVIGVLLAIVGFLAYELSGGLKNDHEDLPCRITEEVSSLIRESLQPLQVRIAHLEGRIGGLHGGDQAQSL